MGVRNLSGHISSKDLLLFAVRRIENSANNGETLIIFVPLIAIVVIGLAIMVQLLEDQKLFKTIPWEVDLQLIMPI